MRASFFISGLSLFLSLFFAPSLRAQVQIDISKITCDQFVLEKMGPPRLMAAWLSGFYNGKRDNRIIDSKTFEENLSKLQKFCYDEKNFKVPVLRAVEQAIGRK